MPTPNQITAQVVAAETLALSTTQMVSLIDLAIANIIAGSTPKQSYSIGGRSLALMSVKDLIELRKVYAFTTEVGDRGFINQACEL